MFAMIVVILLEICSKVFVAREVFHDPFRSDAVDHRPLFLFETK